MNRAVLLIGGVVAAGVLLVAGLLGAAVLGGSAGDGEATRSAVPVQPLSETPPALRATTSAPTATPDAPVATATATPVPTATPTPTQVSLRTPIPTPTPDPRVAAEEFEPAAIEERVVELINDRRERANLTRLDPDGGNADRLRWMTRNHSAAMAEFGSATHEIDGETSADRFEEYQLMSRCRWSKESGGIVSATRNRLEVVGTALAGQPYPGEDGQRINTNETMVAEAIAKVWWDTFYEDRLHRPGASEVGVGVHVHWTGEAYATVALCG